MDGLGARSKGATVSFTASEDIAAVSNNVLETLSRSERQEIKFAAGKQVVVRKIIAQSCIDCPPSKDAWLETANIDKQENAKLVLADAVIRLPHSVKIWYKAVEL
ncbi:hypothetical protein H4Q26_006722 [Puccinia striiformis f. sp. tritici PST-130]|nr:hypothetical protein H4Q26_006722 [Puccinia striiformis f. sp. tritici PST-130]